MASEYNIQQVWLGILDSERLIRYYGRLASRLYRWHLAATAFIAIGSTAAAASLLTHLPTYISASLSMAVVAVALWSSYFDYSKKAAIASTTGDQCGKVALEWERLWVELTSLEDSDAHERIISLKRDMNAITAGAVQYNLMNDKLNEQCAKEANEVAQIQFAFSGRDK